MLCSFHLNIVWCKNGKRNIFSYVEVNAGLMFSISNVTSGLLEFDFQSSDPSMCDFCFDRLISIDLECTTFR